MLRRSQRGKCTSYKEGDFVEIVRGGGISTGQLIRKVDDKKNRSATGRLPHWFVSFEGTDIPNEQISEKSFGRLISNSSGSDSGTRSSKRTTGHAALRGGDNSSVGSSTGSYNDDKKVTNRSYSRKTVNATTSKRKSASNKSIVKMAKKKKIENKKGRISTRSSSKSLNTNVAKEQVPPSGSGGKKPKNELVEEVEKLKLLTGTLYIYRGPHPRVAFVRSV